jgi:cytochrome c551/c552
MQPLGRKPVKFPSKTDHHIIGWENWWEAIVPPNLKCARQDAKREIKQELERLH